MLKEPPAAGGDPPRYAKVALPLPLNKLFTYEIPDTLAGGVFVGCRVNVPFGRRPLSGIVVELSHHSDFSKTRPISSLSGTYLPPELLELSRWMADYYGCSLGESVQSVLPSSLRGARPRQRLEGTVCVADPAARAKGGGDERAAKAREASELLLSRAKKQLFFYRTLVEAGGSVDLNTAMAEWGLTRTVLNGLLEKGVVAVESGGKTSPLETMEKAVTTLTDEQELALEKIEAAIRSRSFQPVLLHGVTGSGKTEVYLRAAKRVLADGGGCIVLVPEIGLLPQATARYRKMFADEVAIIHSRLSGARRYEIWRNVTSGRSRVVVGPRSAVFSPVRNLRLIVVDEEQDDSYKQEEKPRYHARNVALMRGKFENLAVILGSATPSAESLRQALDGRYVSLALRQRVQGSPLPDIHVVDMRRESQKGQWFSETLVDALARNIETGGQSIIFLNKRGHARFVQCNSCGWIAQCRNCDISLTFHRVDNKLKCHFCGFSRASVTRCLSCGSPKLFFSGIGTQRIELDLRGLFPGTRVLRMDADTTAGREGHRKILEKFSTGEYPILLGTQMVSKGHHFPGVNLVGVLHAEEGMNFPDFRSAERTFQQLTQVAGRSGRGGEPGRVIIQTFMPDHYVFRYVCAHDYDGFMKEELAVRKKLGYPPFNRLILVSCSARDPAALRALMEEWAGTVRSTLSPGRVEVLGPAPPLVARVKNRYRQQILLKGALTGPEKEKIMGSFHGMAAARGLTRLVDLRWDVDPESFV